MNKGIMIILDGYGEAEDSKFNAVKNAKTPTLNKMKKENFSLIKTDSEAVGLLKNNMGGSEVGHITIGAGRIVPSTVKLIADQIKNGKFEKNKEIKNLCSHLKTNKSDLHLIGLMSDKNVHSDIKHLFKILDIVKNYAKNIYIHFVTDGRDCGEFDSLKYLKMLKNYIKDVSNCSILSVSGRFYAMDREKVQERTNLAFNSMFNKQNEVGISIEDYIKSQHKKGNNDQFVVPAYVKNETYKKLNKKDAIFLFNFREDRVRQMAEKCVNTGCKVLTMANVGNVKTNVVYKQEKVNHTLSEHLSNLGVKHIKISETTKYAHVTYYLNGGREIAFENEQRVHIPTIETTDYALTPEMRANEITDEVLSSMQKEIPVIIVNYSNADMIGHTGNYESTVKALECLDKCVKKVITNAKKHDYKVLITADHGNAEEMRTKNGEIHTAHTLNKVICKIENSNVKLKKYGELKDIAPTFLELLDIKENPYFTGKSLIKKK